MFGDDPIYERLNQTHSIQDFVIESVDLFEQMVDKLINRVFRKADFAIQSVVDSLFMTSGPLFELTIRLKVLLGLGVINQQVFEDINYFLQFKADLEKDNQTYSFDHPIVFQFIQKLHFCPQHQLDNIEFEEQDKQSLLYQVKALRREKLLRSCLMLTLSEIYQQLEIESPL